MTAYGVRPKVLLVDDDPALLDALAEALELRMPDVEVDAVDSAPASLNLVAKNDYAVIISDVKMPGMDGLQLLTRLRQVVPQTPTLLITGHGETDLAIQALRAGAFDLIQKPLDRDYFVASLKRAIETSYLKREVAAQQEALLQYSQTLERRVLERTEELQIALRAKDEFLSLVSHELRNPLTIIRGNAEALYRRGDLLADEDRLMAMEDLREGTRRLTSLVENLLVLAKVELGKHETQPVELNRLMTEQVAWYKQFSPKRTINVCLPDTESVSICNQTHIELVLNNLLSNADKYSSPNLAIEVICERGEESVVVSVCDGGKGISPEESELIFQPFYRSKTTSDVQGMGIGLAVSKRLIELNGGRIWLRERSAHLGTCFSFSLPVRALVSETAPQPIVTAQSPAGGPLTR